MDVRMTMFRVNNICSYVHKTTCDLASAGVNNWRMYNHARGMSSYLHVTPNR